MGCAPNPNKAEGIPKTNAQPSRQEVTSIDKENRHEDGRVSKVRFEDLTNNDLTIHV